MEQWKTNARCVACVILSPCSPRVVYKLHIGFQAVQIASLVFTRRCVVDENQPHCSSCITSVNTFADVVKQFCRYKLFCKAAFRNFVDY